MYCMHCYRSHLCKLIIYYKVSHNSSILDFVALFLFLSFHLFSHMIHFRSYLRYLCLQKLYIKQPYTSHLLSFLAISRNSNLINVCHVMHVTSVVALNVFSFIFSIQYGVIDRYRSIRKRYLYGLYRLESNDWVNGDTSRIQKDKNDSSL